MTSLFHFQLILSFIIGGAVIATLSFIAEKTPKHIAGVILSLPSTVVISFMFIAWTTSPQAIGDIVPGTMITGSTVMLFAITYVYLAKIKLQKIYSMPIAIVESLSVWAIFSLPFAIIKFDNLPLSIIIYIIVITISFYILTVRNNCKTNVPTRSYSIMQKIGRAVFAGSVITLAVYLSKTVHPFWGGIFSGFPAVYTSTFIIMHWYYGPDMLQKITKAVPKGSLVYVPYILISGFSFPTFGIWLGSLVAYLGSIIVFFIIKKTASNC
jgi:hypothetical protein